MKSKLKRACLENRHLLSNFTISCLYAVGSIFDRMVLESILATKYTNHNSILKMPSTFHATVTQKQELIFS